MITLYLNDFCGKKDHGIDVRVLESCDTKIKPEL